MYGIKMSSEAFGSELFAYPSKNDALAGYKRLLAECGKPDNFPNLERTFHLMKVDQGGSTTPIEKLQPYLPEVTQGEINLEESIEIALSFVKTELKDLQPGEAEHILSFLISQIKIDRSTLESALKHIRDNAL